MATGGCTSANEGHSRKCLHLPEKLLGSPTWDSHKTIRQAPNNSAKSDCCSKLQGPPTSAESIALRMLCIISLLTVGLLKEFHVPVLSASAPKADRHHGQATSCGEASHEADANLRGLGMWSVDVGIVHLESGEVAAAEACGQSALLIHNEATGVLVQFAALGWVGAERIVLAILLLGAKLLAGRDRGCLGHMSSMKVRAATGSDCGNLADERPQEWKALFAEVRLLTTLQSQAQHCNEASHTNVAERGHCKNSPRSQSKTQMGDLVT